MGPHGELHRAERAVEVESEEAATGRLWEGERWHRGTVQFTKVHSYIIHLSPSREQPKCLSTAEWVTAMKPYHR